MADSTNKILKTVTSEITSGGGVVDRVVLNRHAKVYFTNPSGKKQMMVMSVSPSDVRAARYRSRVLRQLMAADKDMSHGR